MVPRQELTLGQHLRQRVLALRAGTLDRVAHAFARVRYSMPDAHPRAHDLVLHRDVVYGPTDEAHHRLDVYVPTRADKPLPVVMYVHGGGFSMLSKETHRVMALAIARQGYVVFNVNYRLGPRYLYPAPLEDVSTALLWVRERAARYGGDSSRLALAGESAGGNLVTALSVITAYDRPERFAREVFDAGLRLRATIATYPFLDLSYIDNYLSHPRMSRWTKGLLYDAALAYVGHNVTAAARAEPLTSPLLVLEGKERPARPLPPFFVSVGTRDPLLTCSRRLRDALTRLGTPCELHVSPGEIHGYDAMVWRPAAREKWRAAHVFLARHMGKDAATSLRPHGS